MNFKNTNVMSDFVLAVENNTHTAKQIKTMIKNLHTADGFAVIMSRDSLRHLKCSYDVKIDTADIIAKTQNPVLKEIYTRTEAVVAYGGDCI